MKADNKPELPMAELHFILIQKRVNHSLTVDDELWFSFTEPFYEKLKSQLDTDQIELNLAIARISSQWTASTVFDGELLTGPFLKHQRKKIEEDVKLEKAPGDTGFKKFAKDTAHLINSHRKAA